jgi:hypothetical protein
VLLLSALQWLAWPLALARAAQPRHVQTLLSTASLTARSADRWPGGRWWRITCVELIQGPARLSASARQGLQLQRHTRGVRSTLSMAQASPPCSRGQSPSRPAA